MKAPDPNLNALTNIVGLYEELRWLLLECGDVEMKCLLRPDLLPREQVIDIRLHLDDELAAQFISNIRRIRAALTKSEIEPASNSMPVPPPPLPKEDEPWTVAYTPDQLNTALCTLALEPGTSGAGLANEARISIEDMCDICAIEIDLVYWLRGEIAGGVYAKYLNELLRINRIRFERTHAGDSGFQGFSPDEPAPVSNEQTSTDTPPTAGDSTQDEPAATSLDTLPKQQSGGNPAPHFFRQGGPMLPSEREPWYGKFKPDQIYKVLWHWVFVEGNALCCAETTGMSVEECFDIASIYMRELEWSLYARREDAAAYLNNLHWINQTRYELTIWPRQRRAKKEQSK